MFLVAWVSDIDKENILSQYRDQVRNGFNPKKAYVSSYRITVKNSVSGNENVVGIRDLAIRLAKAQMFDSGYNGIDCHWLMFEEGDKDCPPIGPDTKNLIISLDF